MRITGGPDVSETYRQQSSFPNAYCPLQISVLRNLNELSCETMMHIGNTSNTTLYFPVMEALSK